MRHLYCSLIVLLLAAAVGCSGKSSTVVLLPDLDGQVGAVTVRGAAGGERALDTVNQAVRVEEKKEVGETYVMSEAEVRERFGLALDAAPSQPARFLLYFKGGSTELTEESARLIPGIVLAIQDRKSTDTSVVGHADRVGSVESNLKLSTRRALAVSELLVSQGAAPEIFHITSHGEENPLVLTEDEVAEPRNRRVEVIVR